MQNLVTQLMDYFAKYEVQTFVGVEIHLKPYSEAAGFPISLSKGGEPLTHLEVKQNKTGGFTIEEKTQDNASDWAYATPLRVLTNI